MSVLSVCACHVCLCVSSLSACLCASVCLCVYVVCVCVCVCVPVFMSVCCHMHTVVGVMQEYNLCVHLEDQMGTQCA